MFTRQVNTDNIRKEQARKRVLNSLGEMILFPKAKKELIDLMNKHIEHSYNDKVPRVNYKVSNIAVAELLNSFLTLNNKTFNKELSTLMFRYGNQSQSNADGMTMTEISDSVDILAAVSEESPEVEKSSEDEIKLSLINKGIKKKNLINKNVLLFMLVAVLVGILLFWILKANKGKKIGDVADFGAPSLVQ